MEISDVKIIPLKAPGFMEDLLPFGNGIELHIQFDIQFSLSRFRFALRAGDQPIITLIVQHLCAILRNSESFDA